MQNFTPTFSFILLLSTTMSGQLVAQEPAFSPQIGVAASPWENNAFNLESVSGDDGDAIPESVLTTKAGRGLVARLKFLRRSESNLGKAHPSLPKVRAEIESIKRRIATMAGTESSSDDSASPFDGSNVPAQELRRIEDLSSHELRQLILQMAIKIKELDARVQAIESAKKVY